MITGSWSAFCVCVLLALSFPARVGAGTPWLELFDGRSLDGWRASEKPGSFKVLDGAIVCDGPRSHLFYVGPNGDAAFVDFEFEAEVLTRPGANSGVYFHSAYQDNNWPTRGYEVQVNNTATGEGGYRENKKTGSLYAIRNVHRQIVPDGEWFKLSIAVRGKRVIIHVNGVQTVDYTEPGDPPNGGYKDRRIDRGTFALQCHDPGSRVLFRRLRVRSLPPAPAVVAPDAGASPELLALHANNFPVIDFDTHLKGAPHGMSMADILRRQFRTGINAGVAVDLNSGWGRRTDARLLRSLDQLRKNPVLHVGLHPLNVGDLGNVSPAVLAKFDYVIAEIGWPAADTAGGDPEAAMDRWVARLVEVLDSAPIDVWANPTALPGSLVERASTLWTRARMQRVIDVAVRRQVAIEIHERYRQPDVEFIRLAKNTGATFALGASDGAFDYAAQMIKQCELRWQDLWIPGSHPTRARAR